MAEMTPNTYQERLGKLQNIHAHIIGCMQSQVTPQERDYWQDKLNTWIDTIAQNLLDDTLEIPDP